jgi:hypothetical protein
MKRHFIPLTCLCFLSTACSLASNPSADNAFPMEALQGDWGWEGLDECTKSPVRFRFTEEATRMHVSHLTEAPDGSKQLPRVETSYTVLGGSSNRLHVRKDGDGQDDAGQPLTWELVLFEENAFCWHRSDWTPGGCTKAVRRCASSRSE